MNKLYQIGDIIVGKGRPKDENPYKALKGDRSNLRNYVSFGLIGQKRKDALVELKNSTLDFNKYSVWYAPSFGGAKELFDNKAIDWERSGV